jgi:chromosome segregation ATPase
MAKSKATNSNAKKSTAKSSTARNSGARKPTRANVKPRVTNFATPVRRARDLPATYGALYEFRTELKSDIAGVKVSVSALEKRMEVRFKGIEAQFKGVEAQFKGVEAQFKGIEAQIKGIEAQFKDMNVQFKESLSQNHRMLALYEEQNSRNKASFEGAEHVRVKQDEMENRLTALEAFQRDVTSK